ncbi:serine/threonine protein phosphatase 1 [Novosphingobium kunmingense]|uniref:Serine/threonine protein phosphatase 1 n=1 Tax=Novosphingobium kunmingense TaxID=1211806 RepID=A0A2N0HKJ0_9SPHN|nr:metallophosphoesterase family protein [Novosphingobium kunmingense]PKB19467.1 serine/threonine protein phosphatase 1 [Novosphingobium kunmingense]
MPTFRSLFARRPARPVPALPAGQRVYAIGDVHGCARLFDALVDAIEADDEMRAGAETTIVLLGDLIDRGPDSAGVVARARALQQRRPVRLLMGNHEEMLLDALEDEAILREFLRYGGRETLLSYGVDPAAYHAADLAEVGALLRAHVPQADFDFLAGGESRIALGDYLFVHAGVRPGTALDEQRASDLRWIRGPFLAQDDGFGAVVVHGHTIFAKPEIRTGRIGIDTGAYAHGCLTALGLDGSERWLIEAQDNDGAITIAQRSI